MGQWRLNARAGEREAWIAVLALTAAAFALRARGMTQSLALDEAYTFREVRGTTLAALFSQLRGIEANPPLYYMLAWALSRLGNHAIWIRVPSLVLGTGAVPLVYLLGRRTVGTRGGVVAAALMTISPFALFYGSEGRAYAMLIFLSTLSTIVLLQALDRRSARWWVIYGLIATAIAYTHYAGMLVVAAQALWAVWTHRAQWRTIVASNGLVALACLPWYTTRAQPVGIAEVYGGPLHPGWSTFENLLALFPGQPFSQIYRPPLEILPGRRPLILIAAGLLLALALAIGARVLLPRRRAQISPAPRSRSRLTLLVLLAVASPLGIFLYSVTSHDVFLSRYFSASLPALLVLVGWLLTSVPLRAALPALALVFTGVGVGTVKELKPSYARPQWKAVATFIARQARPTDPVLAPARSFLLLPLSVYLTGRHPIYYDVNDKTPWITAPPRPERIAVVLPDLLVPGFPVTFDRPEIYDTPSSCFHPAVSRGFEGIVRLRVIVYEASGLCAYFGNGFSFPEQRRLRRWRWTVQPTAGVVLVNRLRDPRRVTISASLSPLPQSPVSAVVRFGRQSPDRVRIARTPIKVIRDLVVPPGETDVTFATAARPARVAVDIHLGPRPIHIVRKVYLRVTDLSVTTTNPRSRIPVG